jgi:hypothetical protein
MSAATNASYFPAGNIENIFKNLTAIIFDQMHLKEIWQCELKPFDKLKMLSLTENELEVIEKNFFRLNENLKAIWLYGNKLQHGHPNAFDNLQHFSVLIFTINPCTLIDAWFKDELPRALAKIKVMSCFNEEMAANFQQSNNPQCSEDK